MNYLARFEIIDGVMYRFDTRIYLNCYDPAKNSYCVGSIVAKNPGSTIPKALNELAPLELNNDKMLPFVKNRFIDGYRLAEKQIPSNSYIRVWNLFYICDPDLNSACRKASTINKLPICNTENARVPIIWYGWGNSDPRLNLFKERFITKSWPKQFFYDQHSSCINTHPPTIDSFAKHTQGMHSKPVNEHLANIL